VANCEWNLSKVPSKSFPLAAAATKLALICLRNLFLLSIMSESSPPVNKDTYFSVLGKNCNSIKHDLLATTEALLASVLLKKTDHKPDQGKTEFPAPFK
jgi:hypothetical protein